MIKKEIVWIRNLRVVASIAVVVVHVCSQSLLHFPPKVFLGWETLFLVNALSHTAIPIFVMISGALVLAKNPSESGRRVKKIIFLIIFWSIFYTVFNFFFNDLTITFRHFAGSLVRGNAFFHLYYLYIVVGLYLITPLLQWIMKNNQKRTLILTLVTIAIPMVWVLIVFIIKKQVIDPMVSLLFLEYIGYYVLGYYLSTYLFQKRILKMFWLVFIILSGVIFTYVTIKITHNLSYPYHYLSVGVLISSVGLFLLFQHKLNSKPFLTKIKSSETLGIYLLHPVLLILLVRFTPINGSLFHPLVGLTLTVFLVYFCSWLIVIMVKKTVFKSMVN